MVADPAHTIHVATFEELLCGLIVLLPSRDADASASVGEIGALMVDPSAWRRGVGRALMDSALEASTASGYDDVTLWVFEENARARRFYEAQRFATDGATQKKQRNGYRLQEVRYRRVRDVQ